MRVLLGALSPDRSRHNFLCCMVRRATGLPTLPGTTSSVRAIEIVIDSAVVRVKSSTDAALLNSFFGESRLPDSGGSFIVARNLCKIFS